MKKRLKFNLSFKPRFFFEIRLVIGRFKSIPLFSMFFTMDGAVLMIYPLAFSIQRYGREIKPAELTLEERKELERLVENERD